jgi:hypothetical protein
MQQGSSNEASQAEAVSSSNSSSSSTVHSSSSRSSSRSRLDANAAAAAQKAQMRVFSTWELPLLLLGLTRLQLPPSVEMLQLIEQLLLPKLGSYSLHHLSLICYCLGRLRYRPQQGFLHAAVAAFQEKAVAWEQQLQQGAAVAALAAEGDEGIGGKQEQQQQQLHALDYAMVLFGIAMMTAGESADVVFDQKFDQGVDRGVDQVSIGQSSSEHLLEGSYKVRWGVLLMSIRG